MFETLLIVGALIVAVGVATSLLLSILTAFEAQGGRSRTGDRRSLHEPARLELAEAVELSRR